MIENEQQYRITRDWIAKFVQSFSEVIAKPDRDPRFRTVLRDSIESEIEVLRRQVAAYEAARGVRADPLRSSDGAGP